MGHRSEADRAAALKDAENLYKTKADLHQACDFLVENFDLRQHARIEEMEVQRALNFCCKIVGVPILRCLR